MADARNGCARTLPNPTTNTRRLMCSPPWPRKLAQPIRFARVRRCQAAVVGAVPKLVEALRRLVYSPNSHFRPVLSALVNQAAAAPAAALAVPVALDAPAVLALLASRRGGATDASRTIGPPSWIAR